MIHLFLIFAYFIHYFAFILIVFQYRIIIYSDFGYLFDFIFVIWIIIIIILIILIILILFIIVLLFSNLLKNIFYFCLISILLFFEYADLLKKCWKYFVIIYFHFLLFFGLFIYILFSDFFYFIISNLLF